MTIFLGLGLFFVGYSLLMLFVGAAKNAPTSNVLCFSCGIFIIVTELFFK